MARTRWLAVVILALLVLGWVGACSKKSADQGERPSSSTSAPRSKSTPPAASATVAGLPNVGAPSAPTPLPSIYTVRSGDTLSSIAERFGVSLAALVKANNLADPNALQVGQQLKLPSSSSAALSPAQNLLPDSEFVNGPAYVDFDAGTFAMQQGGYLSQYTESVDGQMLSGPEILLLIVHEYSVGPRMLLAVLETKSGWVTNPSPPVIAYPMGYRHAGYESLRHQLAWAADQLNKGYYDWRARGVTPITWDDGSATSFAPTLNAATVGLEYFFSLTSTKSRWETLVGNGAGSFLETYRQMFGDPARYAVEPVVPANTPLPTLALPWAKGDTWFFTGGPHSAWADGEAWSAVDFVPGEGYLGCAVASSWATAAVPGLVIYSQSGQVMIDLDGDGHEQTGWVLLYLHMADAGRVPVDTRVKVGDHIGHPSCEGGIGDASHLHFARKFNGEWIAADGPLPLILSGWQFHSTGTAYEGTATRDGQERSSCECMEPTYNGLVADR